jgi:hypothetical protein
MAVMAPRRSAAMAASSPRQRIARRAARQIQYSMRFRAGGASGARQRPSRRIQSPCRAQRRKCRETVSGLPQASGTRRQGRPRTATRKMALIRARGSSMCRPSRSTKRSSSAMTAHSASVIGAQGRGGVRPDAVLARRSSMGMEGMGGLAAQQEW